MDRFPSNTTLWLILRKFESDTTKNVNITARGVAKTDDGSSGRMYYETPVLNIMNREFSDFVDLQKTLSQIGFNSGSVLIRLSYRRTDQPLEEAMAKIDQYFQQAAEGGDAGTQPITASAGESAAAQAAAGGLNMEPPSAIDTEELVAGPSPSRSAPASLTQETQPKSPVPESAILAGGRQITVFAAPTGTVPKATQHAFNEADYVPSIAHVKLHQSRLESKGRNTKLLSDAELEALEQEKKAKQLEVKETQIRIRFPDQTQVLFPVHAKDTGASLFEYVRGLIVAADQPFEIVYRGAKNPNEKIPDSNSVYLIRDLGFRVPTLVIFHWQPGVPDSITKLPLLKEEHRAQAQPVHVPEPPRAEMEEAGPAPKQEKKPSGGDGRSKEEKLKSLFGIGKKR
jgi:tether containing UBX domain for GLUT4